MLRHTVTKTIILTAVLLAGAGLLFGEQITKIGVVDLQKVFNAFYRETKVIKELYDYWQETEAQMEKIQKEIADLEAKREKARVENDDRAALDYEKRINEKRDYLKDYYSYRKSQYEKKFDEVIKSSAFYNEVLKVIEYIAVRDSYSIILKNTDPSIIYYSKDIDITDDVLNYLKR